MNDSQSINPDEVILDDNNANKGTQRGSTLIEQSLIDLGAGRSILADKHMKVIAGNKTFEKANQLGFNFRVVKTKPNELVIVQRDDLTDEQARLMAYADNRSSELNLVWDQDVLVKDVAAGVNLENVGWYDYELGDLRDAVELPQMGGHVETTHQTFQGDYTPWEPDVKPRVNEQGELEPVREIIVRYRSADYLRIIGQLTELQKHWDLQSIAQTIARAVKECHAQISE